MMRWIFDHVLWDAAGTPSAGVQRVLWATRKVLIALALSAGLDWMEWALHHPPDMAVVVLMHFLFALAIVALSTFVWQRLRSA